MFKKKETYLVLFFILLLAISGKPQVTKANESNNLVHYYGMILNEKHDKIALKKIKKMIESNYKIVNKFDSYSLVAFETKQDINEVNKKIGKYGTIELLDNKKYKMDEENTSAIDSKENWGLNEVNSSYVNNVMGLSGEGINVGVIDTQIDDSHPELKNKVIERYTCDYSIIDNYGCSKAPEC